VSYDAHLWHLTDREPLSEWEALFIHALLEWAKLRTGKDYKEVLDAPCGNGRLHPFLKRFGYDVRGFDASEELVKEAKERGCDCWVGDLRDPEAYKGKYDVIVNWFTSFGYFDHGENLKVLQNFYDALRSGGVLLMDLPNFGEGFPVKEYIGAMRRGDDLVEIMESIPEGKVNHLSQRLYRDEGDKLVLLKEVRVDLLRYSPEELQEIMKGVGFREVHLFETLKTVPAKEKSRRITFLAIK